MNVSHLVMEVVVIHISYDHQRFPIFTSTYVETKHLISGMQLPLDLSAERVALIDRLYFITHAVIYAPSGSFSNKECLRTRSNLLNLQSKMT